MDREKHTIRAVKEHFDGDHAPLFSMVVQRNGAEEYALIVMRSRLDGFFSEAVDTSSSVKDAIAREPEFVKAVGGHVCNAKCSSWDA